MENMGATTVAMDKDRIIILAGVVMEETPIIEMTKIMEEAEVNLNEVTMKPEEQVKKIPHEGIENNGMETTMTTVTGIIEKEVPKVKVMEEVINWMVKRSR